jgi:hypothetical protein
MNLQGVEKIANAVLYEGYMLYPYRASSVKNRKRFNFGVLAPPEYCAAEGGSEASSMRTECLVVGGAQSTVEARVRFLQMTDAGVVERAVSVAGVTCGELLPEPRAEEFQFPPIRGTVEMTAQRLEERLYRIALVVSNRSLPDGATWLSRDEILPYSQLSTHSILAVTGGEFVSLLDPPEQFREAASRCRNIGTWPILAGEGGGRSVMLSSPIILYDYAQVAPESPGDLFDGAEIDEILTLRILTMTDEEKREMREGDERTRRMLERTETLPEEHLQKLHGALRGLRPSTGGAE